MIKFKRVSKKFGETVALDQVSFKISTGEFVFLTGSSGAGKTTLIKLLLKEFEPTAGKVLVGDINLQGLPSKQSYLLRRKIGVVFQDFKLLRQRTVRENVSLALEIIGQEKNAREKVDTVLDRVGLLSRAELFPSQLAGGELQRVCLARALVADPEVIVADEPTGNLDLETTWQIISLLREVNRLGKTVLVSTHNFEVVDSLKCRVLQLKKGKLLRDKKDSGYQLP
ncbi:cell division ATP-binding protein FtsE [Patescibacteria group bacterium]